MTSARRKQANHPLRGALGSLGAALAVGGITLLAQLPLFDRWFSVMDEGHMLLFADLLNQGHLLYRDATIYPLPGAFYLLALAFRIFEPSILLSRWIVALEFSLFVALIYTWMRHVFRRADGTASTAALALCVGLLLLYRVWSFPHWQIYNYSTTALVFLVGSLLSLLRFFDTGRRSALAGAGLCFGLGVFCKQDYGAATLVAASLTLVVHARSQPDARLGALFGWFLGPAAAVGAAAGVHFYLQGQLGFVVQMTVLKHFVGLSTYGYQAFPPLLPLFEQDPALRTQTGIFNAFPAMVTTVDWEALVGGALFRHTAVLDTTVKAYIYGPFLIVAAGILRLWLTRSALHQPQRRQAYLAELALVAIATTLVVLAHNYRPQDYVHLAVLYWPLLCIGVVLGRALWLRLPQGAARVAAALVLLSPVLLAAAYTGRLVSRFRNMHPTLLTAERGGVYASADQVRLMDELVAYIQEHSRPDEPVAVLPYFSIAHFLAKRHGPHAASYILWPFPEYPDRDRRIIDAMEATRTASVIYNYTQFPNFPPVPDYAPELYAYLVEHFETDRVFSAEAFGFKLAALRRQRDGDERGRSLLPELAAGALRIEGPRGTSRAVAADARAAVVATGVWPFRPVLALRPTAGGRTTLAIAVDVEAGAHLRTAVGVHPDEWFRHPPTWVRFAIEARSDAATDLLYERTLDPQQVMADRGWFDVDAPLERYAGRRIELVFSTATAWPHGETLKMGGFGAPRIAGDGPG